MMINDLRRQSTIRSHYRICRAECANPHDPIQYLDQLYNPIPLADICVQTIRRNGLCEDERIPAHLHEIIPIELRVGHFAEFKDILCQPNSYCFSADLRAQAEALLRMLSTANSITQLDELNCMRYVAHKRYPLFLNLLSAQRNQDPRLVLVPPIDIQSVWFTHMLQSVHYYQVASELKIESLPHCACLLLGPKETEEAMQRCKTLWSRAYPDEPFDLRVRPAFFVPEHMKAPFTIPRIVLVPEDSPIQTEQQNGYPTEEDFVADRLWYREFLAATAIKPHKMKEFLSRCQLGYQKYMYLMAKHPRALENMNFAPSPPIDLMWHTHLAQPEIYRKDCMRLIRHVPHHKLLPQVLRTLQTYELRTSQEESMWQKEFGESMSIYAQVNTPPGVAMHRKK